MEHYNQDILTDFETLVVQASLKKRFANYIIDVIFFYLLCILIGVVIAIVNPSLLENFDGYSGSGFIDRLLDLLFYGIYMFIFEAVFKGRTVGKWITGTRAVHEDGSPISVQTALLRGLSRAVPFEAFSAFGDPSYPWHDRWTDSYVIDLKQSGLQVR
jgi:uncharacterized RDD family membrane protein YckC